MPSPTPIVLDCDPGHDDALAITLALARPELEVLAITTVAGNAPLAATTRNALRVLTLLGADRRAGRGGRPGAADPVGPRRGQRPRHERPRRRRPAGTGGRRPAGACDRADPAGDRASAPAGDPRAHRPADEHRPPDPDLSRAARARRADLPDGRLDRRGQRDGLGRVQHLGRPGGGRDRLRRRPADHDDRPRRDPPGDRHLGRCRPDGRPRDSDRAGLRRPARVLRPLPP